MKKILGTFLLALVLLSACKKEDLLPEASRIFRPTVAKDGVNSPSNYIEVTWLSSKEAVSYTAQLSIDSFKTVAVSMDVDTNYALFENLLYDQLYQIRVRGNATDTAKNSKFADLGEVKTPKFPTILNSPTLNDLSDESALVSWEDEGLAVTNIKVYLEDKTTVVKEVALTDIDRDSTYRLVTNLQPSTKYYMELYSGTTLRGYSFYTTKAPFSGILVDLREIEDRPNVLIDTLPTVASGSTIILKKGQTYNITSSYAIDKTLTFVSGNDPINREPAVINLPSNFDTESGATIDSIVFRNVVLTTDDGYSSKYVMNISRACNIGTIKFDGCEASNFRGLVRIKTGDVTVDNFIINNSKINSISGYGVINVDNGGAKVNNFVFTNSTFAKVEKFIASKNDANSILIESCTFNEAPSGGNYLIDFSSFNITLGIKIYNSIFGIGYDVGKGTGVRGYRAASGVIVDVSNTFSLSDYVATNGFANVTAYTRSSTDVFTEPSSFNFKIKDNGFPGRSTAGDPRGRL
ncbi:MAG TPA: DUF5123 domain-containing protein [Pelobium sp.]|nr:DUF5123 domain-containing protein [Pelobium sp.]